MSIRGGQNILGIYLNLNKIEVQGAKTQHISLNEGNPRLEFRDGIPNQGETLGITREVKKVLKKIKNNKATRSDNIPAEEFRRGRSKHVGSDVKDLSGEEDAIRMERLCDSTDIQRDGRHPGVWILQGYQTDIRHDGQKHGGV